MRNRRQFLRDLVTAAVGVRGLIESEVWLEPAAEEFVLGPVAGAVGRVSKKMVLGAGRQFHVVAECVFSSTPDVGERVDFYFAPSAAVAPGAIPVDVDLRNTQFIGSAIVDGEHDVWHSVVGVFQPTEREGYLVVDNQTGAKLEGHDVGVFGFKEVVADDESSVHHLRLLP